METLWFVLLAWMLGVYAALDGFDFGVGALHLVVAKTSAERAQVLRSIGPVWDGNEVWLVAAGGTLFAAFPGLYARAFSGFYLPLIVVLWLLVFRALSIELRHQFEDLLWEQFWDVAFCLSSLLLIVFFGAAVGNLVRGVTYGPGGEFFTPFWTSFAVSAPVGILDWYTLCVAGTAVAALTSHGALWLAARTEGEVHRRAKALSRSLRLVCICAFVLVTAATAWVQPRLLANLVGRPWVGALGVAGLVAFTAVVPLAARLRFSMAFRVSGFGLVLMTMAAGTAAYPDVMPAVGEFPGPRLHELAASSGTLTRMLWWWVPGMLIASSYSVFMYRRMPKVFSETRSGLGG